VYEKRLFSKITKLPKNFLSKFLAALADALALLDIFPEVFFVKNRRSVFAGLYDAKYAAKSKYLE